MSHQPSEHPFFGEVISVYTRAQALADGVLIDAGPMAREAGFRWLTAITAGARAVSQYRRFGEPTCAGP